MARRIGGLRISLAHRSPIFNLRRNLGTRAFAFLASIRKTTAAAGVKSASFDSTQHNALAAEPPLQVQRKAAPGTTRKRRTRAQSCRWRSKHNLLSPEIFHELFEMVAHDIFCSLMDEVRKAGHNVVKVDETTDMPAKEQVSTSLELSKTTSGRKSCFVVSRAQHTQRRPNSFPILKDTLCRLPIDVRRGKRYECAANTRGQNNGLQAQQEERCTCTVWPMSSVLCYRTWAPNSTCDRDFLGTM